MSEIHRSVLDDSVAESSGDLGRFISASILGGLALFTLEMRRRGMVDSLPASEISGPIIDSTAHPILGYTGAWIGLKCARVESATRQVSGMLAGGTALNFIGETIQSFVRSAPETANYFSSQNLPETSKDYAFALLGSALFIHQSRNSKDHEIR